MKKVTVQFVFDGVIKPQENLQGVLFGGDKVLIADGEVGIYDALKTDNPNVVIVDLDVNATDHLAAENPTILIDLIVSDPGGGSFVQV